MHVRVTWSVDIGDDDADLDNPVSIARAGYDKIQEARHMPVLEVDRGYDRQFVDLYDEEVFLHADVD